MEFFRILFHKNILFAQVEIPFWLLKNFWDVLMKDDSSVNDVNEMMFCCPTAGDFRRATKNSRAKILLLKL